MWINLLLSRFPGFLGLSTAFQGTIGIQFKRNQFLVPVDVDFGIHDLDKLPRVGFMIRIAR
jgi:hypothetical protein